MTLQYCTLDVFTDRPFGGNPLAVFYDSPDLPTSLMQNIARELNLSETVFVRPARDARAARRLRIFTPARELPFAGHPTVGAAHALIENRLIQIEGASGDFVLEEEVGLVPIHAQRAGHGPWFVQFTTARLPEEGMAAPGAADLAHLLGLAAEEVLRDGDFAQFYSCGVPFLFVPLRDRAALARVCIDPVASRQLQQSAGTSQVYAFCHDPGPDRGRLRARMFAPEFGIVEDPATGGAAAAFAGYLARRELRKSGTSRWTIEQGVEMGRPSLIYLEADMLDGAVTAVRVGGHAVRIGEGRLTCHPG